MREDFLKFLELHAPEAGRSKILLAVSGGLDSMVMADLFRHHGFNIGIAHCNFMLRGAESDEDAAFVTNYATTHSIPIHTKEFQTAEYAKQRGLSIQMAARELRYGFFRSLLKNYDYLAIAHHRDDEYETTVFNLVKGTGIKGLTGWKALNKKVLRPLLFTDRHALSEYAQKEGISWREDPSNQDTRYLRNMIRHEVIPTLQKINPGLTQSFVNTKRRLRESNAATAAYVQAFIEEHVRMERDDMIIPKHALKSSLAPTLALFEVLKPWKATYALVLEIMEAIDGVGNVFPMHTHQLNIDRENILISPIEETDPTPEGTMLDDVSTHMLRSGDNLVFDTFPNHASLELNIEEPSIELFDKSLLKFPLCLRQPHAGDTFVPLGMTGRKKVSEFMIDAKIPVNLKKRVLVMTSGKDIIWVVGLRMDDRFKVTEETTEILRMTYSHATQPV